jgi:hypothetical protein
MNKQKDPLFLAACRIHRRLKRPAQQQFELMEQRLQGLSRLCREVCRDDRRLRIARQRGWLEAARRYRSELLGSANQLHQLTRDIVTARDQPILPVPAVGPLLAELRQLQDEFEQTDLADDGQSLSAHTDPIVLEGIELGRFSIVLHVSELTSRRDSTCFECVALDPNPAQRNSSVTHPHVSDGALCAGDASLAIAQALSAGRLCEAFLLVRSVLSTYNPQSPYVSLSEWEGARCCDCECTVDADDLYQCTACENRFCQDCISSCDLCQCSCCNDCLAHDAESDHDCCPRCCQNCNACRRVVDNESVEPVSGLCPQCVVQTEPPEDQNAVETAVSPSCDTLPESQGSSAASDPVSPRDDLTLVCCCQSSESYPDQVYAMIRLPRDQAAVLLGLRSAMESVRPLLPDGFPQSIHVRDVRVSFAREFRDEYEQVQVDWDLSEWHTFPEDPLNLAARITIEGDAMVLTQYGLYWTVSPAQDRCQIIQTDTLLWHQLEAVVAGSNPFHRFTTDPPQVPSGT